jgi:hypothetical protein
MTRTSRPQWQILGEVLESDSLAYVVYRRSGSTFWLHEPGDVAVLYLRRVDSDWLYRLTSHDLTFPSLDTMLKGALYRGRRVQ